MVNKVHEIKLVWLLTWTSLDRLFWGDSPVSVSHFKENKSLLNSMRRFSHDTIMLETAKIDYSWWWFETIITKAAINNDLLLSKNVSIKEFPWFGK